MSDDDRNEQPLNPDTPDHLEYSKEYVRVDCSIGPAIIDITECAADQPGELALVDLSEPGTHVEADGEIVELESSEAVQPLISPVVGTIRYVNRDVADDPSVVNDGPYGEGQLLKVKLDDDGPGLPNTNEHAEVVRQLLLSSPL